jgi:hypothetical protein
MSELEPIPVEAESESAFAQAKLKILASKIRNNDQFRNILQQSAINLRKAVYEEIKPHLRFKPLPYWAMKFKNHA